MLNDVSVSTWLTGIQDTNVEKRIYKLSCCFTSHLNQKRDNDSFWFPPFWREYFVVDIRSVVPAMPGYACLCMWRWRKDDLWPYWLNNSAIPPHTTPCARCVVVICHLHHVWLTLRWQSESTPPLPLLTPLPPTPHAYPHYAGLNSASSWENRTG